MKRNHLWSFAMFFSALVLMSACSKSQTGSDSDSDSDVAKQPVVGFKVFSGTLNRPAPGTPYDTVSVKYDIAWPVKGSEEAVNALRSWIVTEILGDNYTPGQDLSPTSKPNSTTLMQVGMTILVIILRLPLKARPQPLLKAMQP